MEARVQNKLQNRLKALSAKVSPLSRLSGAAERLAATIARGGSLPTAAELRPVGEAVTSLNLAAASADSGEQNAKLCVALVQLLLAIARWPSPSSAAEAEAYKAARKLFDKARRCLEDSLPDPSGELLPTHRCSSARVVGALLRSDVLHCLSRKLHSDTEVLIQDLEQHRSGPSGSSEPPGGARLQLLAWHTHTTVDLLLTCGAAAYAQLPDHAHRGTRGPQLPSNHLCGELVEAVRSSCVLEHLARGVAVLATCQGAGLAPAAQAPADGGEAPYTVSRYLLNYSFLSLTGINPAPAEVALGTEEQLGGHGWTWPPPVNRVDLAVCGPWSQHLMLAWGLHHLHALDGEGHCGLRPELVRGLPQVWEERDTKQDDEGGRSASGAGAPGAAAPQGAASSSAAGAAGGAASAGAAAATAAGGGGSSSSSSSSPLRVLQSHALWRLTELLQRYAESSGAMTKLDRATLKALSKSLSNNAAVLASVAAAMRQVRDAGLETEMSDRQAVMHKITTGMANLRATSQKLLSRSVPATRPGGPGSGSSGGSSAAWTVSGEEVWMLAARVVRAAVASARAWQQEQQQGDRNDVISTSSAVAGGGTTQGTAEGGAGPSETPLVLSKPDAMALAVRALEAFWTSVRAWEAGRGATARAGPTGEGAVGQEAAAHQASEEAMTGQQQAEQQVVGQARKDAAREGAAEEAAAREKAVRDTPAGEDKDRRVEKKAGEELAGQQVTGEGTEGQQAAGKGAGGGVAAAPGQGRSRAQRGGREGKAVRLRCELYRLGFEVVHHVVPCCGGGGLGGLVRQLRLGLPCLPCDGLVPPEPPPRLAAALAAGYLPALERLLRRCGREATPADLRLAGTLLRGAELGARAASGATEGAAGMRGKRQRQLAREQEECLGSHDVLWLLAYGDRDQAGALVYSLRKALDNVYKAADSALVQGQGQGELPPGSETEARVWGPPALHAAAAWLLGQGVEVCERMAAAAGAGCKGAAGRGEEQHEHGQQGGPCRPQQQLQEVVSLAVQVLGKGLSSWVCTSAQSVLASGRSRSAAGEDADNKWWHLTDTVPALLRVQRAMTRTALHPLLCAAQQQAADGDAAGGSGGSGSVCGNGSGRTRETAATGAGSSPVALGVYDTDVTKQWEKYARPTAIGTWVTFLPHLPPGARAQSARLAVDIAWCLQAFAQRTAGCSGHVPLLLFPQQVQMAAEVAQGAGDLDTLHNAQSYLAWSKEALPPNKREFTWEGGDRAPEGCVRLQGRPWLLGLAEARRQLPRGCWNWGCRQLEGDSEDGEGLAVCGGCRGAWYCCRECQKEHWAKGGHKAECKRAAGAGQQG